MYLKLIFSFVVILFLSSCGGPTGPIETNDGSKWKINAEMMPHLEASKKSILDFATNGEKDYKALAKQLKENNKSLISSCTMSGKSHDELHKWLHSYMGKLDELENAKNEKEASEVFVKIEQSFETFDHYFQ